MHRRWTGLILLGCAALIALPLPPAPRPSYAEGPIQAMTSYAAVAYSRPDRASPIVGVLSPQAEVILEARSVDAAWILGHSTHGGVRGWLLARHLALPDGVSVPGLLVSSETLFVPESAPAASAYQTISLTSYPAVPSQLGRVQAIYERGRILGTDPHTLSKVGDCLTDNAHFLTPFSRGSYNLGRYPYLQGVVSQFSASLGHNSLAAYDGLVTSAVLDPLFADPMACLPGETPLRCEYRMRNPSVAIIMFGAQDLLYTPAGQFDRNLRRIVHETIEAGIIPILSTFPVHLGHMETSRRFNQIVVGVALDYDVPLINLWLALEALDDRGLDDGRHLSEPVTTAADLTPDNLQRGFPLRNLLTLQALDAVWRGVAQG